MGKRLPKAQLLEEIGKERAALDELLRDLHPRQMTLPDVTGAGWSIKDILGHLVGWQQRNLAWYEAGKRGEDPAVPEKGYTWKEVPKLNEVIYKEHQRRSLKAVLADYASYHRRMRNLIEEVSEADLIAIGRFPWTGPSWSLSDYIRANTASHYRWAIKHIRKWLRSKKSQDTGE